MKNESKEITKIVLIHLKKVHKQHGAIEGSKFMTFFTFHNFVLFPSSKILIKAMLTVVFLLKHFKVLIGDCDREQGPSPKPITPILFVKIVNAPMHAPPKVTIGNIYQSNSFYGLDPRSPGISICCSLICLVTSHAEDLENQSKLWTIMQKITTQINLTFNTSPESIFSELYPPSTWTIEHIGILFVFKVYHSPNKTNHYIILVNDI